jgi:RNA-directed DNA polymerase
MRNPEKTKIVYCKDDRRKGKYPNVQFEFLGFSFQPRQVRGPRSGLFIGFTPAVSRRAAKAMRDVTRSWRLQLQSPKSLEELSRQYNPIIRGWVNYYGSYFRSDLYKVFNPLNLILAKWAMRKYKRFHGHQRRASRWMLRLRKRSPSLFAHWQLAQKPAAGR